MYKSQVTLVRKRLMGISGGLLDAVSSNDITYKDRKVLDQNRLLLNVIDVLMNYEKTMKES